MGLKQNNQSALLDAIYGAAIKPQDYLEFTKVWDATILKYVEHDRATSLSAEADLLELRTHFNRAFEIFEKTRMGLKQSQQEFLDAQAFAAALCKTDGSITACNDAFSGQYALGPGESLSMLSDNVLPLVSTERQPKTESWLRLTTEQTAFRYFDHEGSSSLLLLERFDHASTTSTPIEPLLLVRSNKLEWSTNVSAFLKESFLLTTAETEVSESLMMGLSSDEIAAKRNSSNGTVRQQIKSVMEKTETNKQAELMALLVSLHHLFATRPKTQAKRQVHLQTVDLLHETIIVDAPLWGSLEYEVYGRPAGVPVVYLNSQMSPARPTPEMLDAMAEAGLIVFAPRKPGIGATELEKQATDPVGFVRAFVSLLEAEGKAPEVLVGQGMSGVAIIDYAAQHPEYQGSIVTIDTGIPFTRREQFEDFPPVAKRIFWTVWECPELFFAPFAFASEALFASEEGERAFLNEQFKDIPHDQTLLEDPKFYELARSSMRDFMMTPKRSADELVHWMHDWTEAFLELVSRRDVIFLQSELHDFLRYKDVADYLRAYPRAKAILLQGMAQLCVVEHPEIIARHIVEAVGRRPNLVSAIT